MKKLIIAFVSLVCCTTTYAYIALDNSTQLLLVVADNWDAYRGVMTVFERESPKHVWQTKYDAIPVNLGKNGLAWGKGLHHNPNFGPLKKEGDKRSPAGIFALGAVFGHTNYQYLFHLKMPYLTITPSTQAIDDPNSKYYNSIVRPEEIKDIDWVYSEMMGLTPEYLRGVIVEHNVENTPEDGANIFLHIWQNPITSTSGCTAMSGDNMERIVHWLDPQQHPLLVQLPRDILNEVKDYWDLPKRWLLALNQY